MSALGSLIFEDHPMVEPRRVVDILSRVPLNSARLAGLNMADKLSNRLKTLVNGLVLDLKAGRLSYRHQ